MPQQTEAKGQKSQTLEKGQSTSGGYQTQNTALGLQQLQHPAGISRATVQRARQAPEQLSGHDLLALQRSAGNQAVLQLLGRSKAPPVQRSLTVGPAKDRYEDEADRVATEATQRNMAPPQVGAKGGSLESNTSQEIHGARGGKLIADMVRAPAKGTIQRAWALVRSPAWGRVPSGPLDKDPEKRIKQVAGGTKTHKFPKMYRAVIADDDSQHIKDKNGNIVWYRHAKGDKGAMYLPASKLLTGIGPSGNESSDPDMGEEDIESLLGSLGDLPGSVDNDLVEAQQGYAKKEAAIQQDAIAQGVSEEDAAELGLSDTDEAQSEMVNKSEVAMWMAGSALGTVTGIMGMASSLRTLRDNEAGAWDKVDAVFEYFASGAGTIGSLYGLAGSTSTVINMHAEEGSKLADATSEAASWGAGYQAMFGVLSSGIMTVKGVADLVHMIYEEQTGKAVHDRDEYLSTVADLLTSGLDAVRSVLVSIRTITQLVQGGIMDVFDNIIPGLDIAVAAVNMIFEGYYLIESAVHHWWMKTRKKKLVAELGGNEFVKEAQQFYASREARKANASGLKDKNAKKINKLDTKSLNTQDSDKKVGMSEKKSKLRAQNITLDKKQTDAEQEMVDYEADNHPSRKDIAEIDLVSELKDVNRKRITRQAIHIGSDLMKIAGSITALVAGPGAPAGIALKAAAVGIDVSLPIARSLKQYGRNKAAKNQATDKTGRGAEVVNKIFNADKSTTAKLANRKKQAVKILLVVADLNRHLPIGKDPVKRKELAKDIRVAERYIRAAGASPERLYHANGNAGEQIKILVEALCKRELG
jgi:hypothetical protein